MPLYEPEHYTDKGLAEHGKRIAARLGLTREQIRVLVPEIRNAIAPAALSIGSPGYLRRDLKAEDYEDIRASIRRLIALAHALAESATTEGK